MNLFGRKYQLQVTVPQSSGQGTQVLTVTDSAWEPEALRITFDVQTSWWSAPWYADICVYNLNEQTQNLLMSQTSISQGLQVTLQAGYLNGDNYGIIWSGSVLQLLWERENQTDFKLTLHCMNWLGGPVNSNSANPYFYPGQVTQQRIVADIAANSYHPIGVGYITPTLANKQLPRGKAVFGNSEKYLREIARDNNCQYWLGQGGLLNFHGLSGEAALKEPIDASGAITYTPTTGIIGTPAQTQLGVDVRLLLDARVRVKIPCMCITVKNTQVQQLLYSVGQYPGLLNQDGTYAVVGARYRGDTRGQEWYVEVTGWYLASAQLAALAAGDGIQLANGSGKLPATAGTGSN